MCKIHISPTKKTDLQNWLIDRAAPPSWLGSVPSPCVYVLFCHNKKNVNCCDRNNVLIIPANGYSVKVGMNMNPERAIAVNYSAGPMRPCGSGDKVLLDVLEYIIIFDPKKLGLDKSQLKSALKKQAKELIANNFTPIDTTSRDWFPFLDGKGETCNIIEYLNSIDLSNLNLSGD